MPAPSKSSEPAGGTQPAPAPASAPPQPQAAEGAQAATEAALDAAAVYRAVAALAAHVLRVPAPDALIGLELASGGVMAEGDAVRIMRRAGVTARPAPHQVPWSDRHGWEADPRVVAVMQPGHTEAERQHVITGVRAEYDARRLPAELRPGYADPRFTAERVRPVERAPSHQGLHTVARPFAGEWSHDQRYVEVEMAYANGRVTLDQVNATATQLRDEYARRAAQQSRTATFANGAMADARADREWPRGPVHNAVPVSPQARAVMGARLAAPPAQPAVADLPEEGTPPAGSA